uniref:Uncharacterized protein n=1 Tax=Arundo donax TaxID=35708 RepID=A0A0A9HG10_ARUDO
MVDFLLLTYNSVSLIFIPMY